MVETETYGTNSIKFQAINTWNKLQQTNVDLTRIRRSKTKNYRTSNEYLYHLKHHTIKKYKTKIKQKIHTFTKNHHHSPPPPPPHPPSYYLFIYLYIIIITIIGTIIDIIVFIIY